MNKPLGVKVIACLAIAGGLFTIGGMLFGGGLLQEAVKKGELTSFQMLYGTAFAVLGIIFGIGLLKVKKWAWFGEVIMTVLSVILQLISIPASLNKNLGSAGIVGIVLGLLISGVIIAYLLRKDIKQLFQISI